MKKQSKPIHLIIYRVTGKQLFFRVPENVCKECNMSVGIVHSIIKELNVEGKTEIIVKPWINDLIGCLLRGSWHPPIVTINGKRFSQGMVTDRVQLVKIFKSLLQGV